MLIENHFKETEELLRQVSAEDVANWLLNEGFFPEQYILPPSFQVLSFELKQEPYNKDLSDLTKRQLINISYPKTPLTSRIFGIQHPYNFHDIVFYLKNEWNSVVEHLFHQELKIYSYSLPIPVSKKHQNSLSNLRSGRMIYEWLEMAEEDLVLESGNYQFIARTDITNFYASIYTHSIGWALHGREKAFLDKTYNLLGNKIDRLFQYSNDGRTNGIPVGSVLSDLIGEIILAKIDRDISINLKKIEIDFIAVRFKDDYRILCKSEDDAKKILKTITQELSTYNLSINETKTSILKLPDGLYRKHDREYFPYTLRRKTEITFKVFEHTLLIALDIHRNNPGTSILEKFISEIFDRDKTIKIKFSLKEDKEIKKVISLLFLLKRDSEKIICHVLSVTEELS
jgi:retron-type reverse transcriptase